MFEASAFSCRPYFLPRNLLTHSKQSIAYTNALLQCMQYTVALPVGPKGFGSDRHSVFPPFKCTIPPEKTMNPTKSDWLIPGALMALSLVPVIAGIMRLAQLAGGATITPENSRFFEAPWIVLLHIPAAIVFSILGAFQFSPGFRRRKSGWHRAAGRILASCGLLVAASGLWMTQHFPWPQGDGQLLYLERLVFGSAMVLSIVLGLNAIRRRDFATHGAWMTRAYAIGLGAGTQALTHLPWFLFVGSKPGELPRGLLMGAGWVINIVVAEWIIRTTVVLVMPTERRFG